MGLIILHQLKTKTRTIIENGCCIKTDMSVFIGATDDELCQFGIGVMNAEQKRFWSLLCPHSLIQAWRGMQILDAATFIFPDTIAHAFYAGSDDDKSGDCQRGITELGKQIPDIVDLRRKVLHATIDDAILDEILEICNRPDNGIDVSTSELKKAVETGVIHQTEAVSQAYQISVDKEAQREHDKKISKQPLPEGKSFRAFCEKFQICHLFDDPYSDWPEYWQVERIDENLVYHGLRFEGVEEVWCAENPKGPLGTGHIGQPVLQLDDDRIVVLALVRFIHDDMRVAIRTLNSDSQPEWLPLRQLSARQPQFVGLTFDTNDCRKLKITDVNRGYIKLRRPTNLAHKS